MTQTSSQRQQLARLFRPDQVKTRQQGGSTLSYIPIEGYIGRLNEVLDSNWSLHTTSESLELLAEKDKYDKNQYFAKIAVNLDCEFTDHDNIGDTEHGVKRTRAIRSGVGSAVASDPDQAYKTALAEATKKACNQFGIAAELWDERYRSELPERAALISRFPVLSEKQIKQSLVGFASRRGYQHGEPLDQVKGLLASYGIQLAEDAELTVDVWREVLGHVLNRQ